jgi:uncharacterized membrane protein
MNKKSVLNDFFYTFIVIKGIDGFLESVGGLLLFFIKPATLNALIVTLTQHELLEDPHDLIASRMVQFASNLSIKSEHFGAIYLFIHGLIKISVMTSLLKGALWGYRVAFIFLSVFIVYQLYRFSLNHSAILLGLTIFDCIFLLLVWKEYLNTRARPSVETKK